MRMNDEHNDLLAVAVRDDPLSNKYLPPMYAGFDMSSDSWAHSPSSPARGRTSLTRASTAVQTSGISRTPTVWTIYSPRGSASTTCPRATAKEPMSWCSTRLRCCGAADTGTALAKSSSRIRRTRTRCISSSRTRRRGRSDGKIGTATCCDSWITWRTSIVSKAQSGGARTHAQIHASRLQIFRAAAGATHSRSGVVGRGLPPAPHEDAAGDRRQVSGVFHGKVPKQRAGT